MVFLEVIIYAHILNSLVHVVTLKGNYFRGKRIWYESKEGKSLVVCPSSIVVFPPISFSYHLP